MSETQIFPMADVGTRTTAANTRRIQPDDTLYTHEMPDGTKVQYRINGVHRKLDKQGNEGYYFTIYLSGEGEEKKKPTVGPFKTPYHAALMYDGVMRYHLYIPGKWYPNFDDEAHVLQEILKLGKKHTAARTSRIRYGMFQPPSGTDDKGNLAKWIVRCPCGGLYETRNKSCVSRTCPVCGALIKRRVIDWCNFARVIKTNADQLRARQDRPYTEPTKTETPTQTMDTPPAVKEQEESSDPQIPASQAQSLWARVEKLKAENLELKDRLNKALQRTLDLRSARPDVVASEVVSSIKAVLARTLPDMQAFSGDGGEAYASDSPIIVSPEVFLLLQISCRQLSILQKKLEVTQ